MRPWPLAVVIALLFSFFAMRGASYTDVTFNDQARHALNGLALHDLVKDGAVNAPLPYLKRYFSRWPALSMPYHPPLFPAVEALYYAVFGPSYWSARLCVATFVFGAALLLFMLVRRTHQSARLALAVLIFCFSLKPILDLSSDVMLEMPAMFFAFAALIGIARFGEQWNMRDALAAGVFGGLAVWTKQTLFIGLIPLFLILGRASFSTLRTRSVWTFVMIFGGACAGLGTLMYAAGIRGTSRAWGSAGFGEHI